MSGLYAKVDGEWGKVWPPIVEPPAIEWPPPLLPESPYAGTSEELWRFSGGLWEQSEWNHITGRMMVGAGGNEWGDPRGLLEVDPFTAGAIESLIHLPSDHGFPVTVSADGTTYWCGGINRTTLLVYRDGEQPSIPITGLGAFGIRALAVDENDVLWGAGFNPTGNVTQMFTIAPDTGAATSQGASFVSPTAGFAVQPGPWGLKAGFNGSLYLSYWGSWSANGRVVRFDIATLTADTSFPVITDAGSLAAFGDLLMTQTFTAGRVILWDAHSGAELRTWPLPANNTNYSSGVMNVNHPEKGRCVITPSRQAATHGLFAHYY